MLFTHRGLSGPAILQISSYWREGSEIALDMLPATDLFEALRAARAANGRQALHTALASHLPRRLAAASPSAAGRSPQPRRFLRQGPAARGAGRP